MAAAVESSGRPAHGMRAFHKKTALHTRRFSSHFSDPLKGHDVGQEGTGFFDGSVFQRAAEQVPGKHMSYVDAKRWPPRCRILWHTTWEAQKIRDTTRKISKFEAAVS